ncbi:unnamed protein product [Effrenium voratum]|uniref:K Homology domain-containing protein n=1 Tax=Effrenium voratum TaxID=2562239 RepID=A0AA36IW58_9DINO|nr:unnamed protein product [Effrenium voratum]
MAFHGTPVEVRKNQKSTTWYSSELIDINGDDNIKVRFEDDIWPVRDVPSSSVRRLPEESADDFDPQVDEVVEVLLSATESSPSGWALGKVKSIKNSFYFITFDPTQKGKQDLIVEKTALRRSSAEQPLDLSTVQRKLLPIDSDLHVWIRSQDSSGCLSHVQHKCNLLVANCTNVEMGSTQDPEVLLIGGERAVHLATMLLEQIHFKYQIEMQRFHEQREHLMERLNVAKQWHSAQSQQVFEVDQAMVGRIIGKKGENIKDIRDRHNVAIWIEDPRGNSNNCRVTVSGQTDESVSAARDELEFITVSIPVEQESVGWILGKGYQTISAIARKTELHHARYDDKSKTLELCGLRHQVEDAKLLISVHQEYLPVYQDMDEEQNAIQMSFDQLDGVAKGKGKKGSKGDEKPRKDGEKGKGKDEKGKEGKEGKDGKGFKGSKGDEASQEEDWYSYQRKGKDGKEGKDGKGNGWKGSGKEIGGNGKEGKEGKGQLEKRRRQGQGELEG